MPQLKQISCCVQWSNTNAPFQEYGTIYGDGVVETFITVPSKPQGFCLRLKSHGFIHSGLAMIVFMDGNYQCNRARVNLLPPKKGWPSNRTEVEFLLRQKEKSQGDGVYMGREWRFDDHNIGKLLLTYTLNRLYLTLLVVKEPPEGCQAGHFNDLGVIEVLVLRCEAVNSEDAEYEGSSSGEDSDVLAGRLVKEEKENKKGNNVERSNQAQAASTGISEAKTDGDEEGLGALMNIFDGANDGHELYDSHRGNSGHETGRWVWHQKQSPYDVDTAQCQHQFLRSQDYSRLPACIDYSDSLPQYQHNAHESAPNQGPKRVHFDYGVNEHPRRQFSSNRPPYRSQTWAQSPSNRPPSRERNRSNGGRTLSDPRQRSGPPYESQRIDRVWGNQNCFEKRPQWSESVQGRYQDRSDLQPDQLSNHARKNWMQSLEHDTVQTNQEFQPKPLFNQQTMVYPSRETLPTINQFASLPPQARYCQPDDVVQNGYPLQLIQPHPMYEHNPAQFPCLPSHPIPYWPVYYPESHTHSLPTRLTNAPNEGGIQRNNFYVAEENISPTNTFLNASGVSNELRHSADDWPNNHDNDKGANGGWDLADANGDKDRSWANDNDNVDRSNGWSNNENKPNNATDNWNNADAGGQPSDGNGDNQGWNNDVQDNNATNGNDGWGNANTGPNSGDNDWRTNNGNNQAVNNTSWQDEKTGGWDNTTHNNQTFAPDLNGISQNSNNGKPAAEAADMMNAVRQLYGPHGPYYSLRAFRADEPPPDAEEEPRFDVPETLASSRLSTKQVQPGPGYRYFKRRMVPEYLDTLEHPYARFVFKYRTKDQLFEETGIETDVEPTGNQQIQELQNLDKQSLVEMLMRAKSALGGKIPSPPATPSTTANESDCSLPVAVDAPSHTYLKYSLPPLRPSILNQSHYVTKVKGEDVDQVNIRPEPLNSPKVDNWTTPTNQWNDCNNNRTSTGNSTFQQNKYPPPRQSGAPANGGTWNIPNDVPPRPPTPPGYQPRDEGPNDGWNTTTPAQEAVAAEPASGW